MKPHVLALKNADDLVLEFNKIGVDWRGSAIMAPKGYTRVIKIYQIPSFTANILKQEMLSIGGDLALSRASVTGSDKKTDCLILGNFSQILKLIEKLKQQPFGLSGLGEQIKNAVDNFDRKISILDIGGKKLRLGRRTLVMGIINATPDSFSGDGIFGLSTTHMNAYVQGLARAGADLLDVGGESTRPGAKKIAVKEELRRVMPVLKCLKKCTRVPISIDTTKSQVAHAALDLGACMVNDISALRFDKKMAKLIARYKASCVLMHMAGTPQTMQKNPRYKDVMRETIEFLDASIKKALDAGIAEDKIIVDPGIGFGKNMGHNITLLKRLKELKCLHRPILVGLSRKYFIGKILNATPQDRIWGTAAAVSLVIEQGADIVRVHDIKEIKQVVVMADALVRGENN